MQLGVITPLQNAPLNAESLAVALDVNPTKLRPLLYSLVIAKPPTVEDERFVNTPESDHYLVHGRPDYLGEMHYLLADLYRATL